MHFALEFPLLEISVGNLKVGKDTMIYNMCAAMDCPADKAGLCPLSNPSQLPLKEWASCDINLANLTL